VTQRLPDWYQDWSNDFCIIIAGGPSAKDYDYQNFRDAGKFIVVNNSWALAPWADVILCADGRWWGFYYQDIKELPAIKVTLDQATATHYPQVHLLKLIRSKRTLLVDEPGTVGLLGNSGSYALNLAVQFKCKKIILCGFDFHINNGMHWHGKHVKGLNNPLAVRLEHWRKLLDHEAGTLQKLGVEVINASKISALQKYPKISLGETLERWRSKNVNL
jgi:hypothetical protein